MQHSIHFCGEFGKVLGFSAVGDNQKIVKMIDEKNNKTYLFRIDNANAWSVLDYSIKINQLRSVLIVNGVRIVSEQVKLE